tara:strand:- start:1589 stop:2374 length:786 start_codon:yes stop_codon:yes gene_type:complete
VWYAPRYSLRRKNMPRKNGHNTKAMVKKEETTELAAPSFVESNDSRGTEHLTKDDMQMPRLALAQKMSNQLDPQHPSFLPDLRVGELFNDVTGNVYGSEPVRFAVVRSDPPRGIEFSPLEEGGGVKDMNVPLDDPRMSFGPDGEVPVATRFYDYVIILVDHGEEMIAMSLARTGVKAAKSLNTLLKVRKGPGFAGVYTATPSTETNNKGTYGVWKFKNDGWVTQDQYSRFNDTYESLKEKHLVIDRENHPRTNLSEDMPDM